MVLPRDEYSGKWHFSIHCLSTHTTFRGDLELILIFFFFWFSVSFSTALFWEDAKIWEESIQDLHEKLCELKDNGWKNVTSQNIRLLEEPSKATRFILPGNRSLVTPKNIFLGVFNDGMLSMIAEETSAKGKCHSPDSAKSTTTFDTQDVVLLIAAIVECCGNQYT